MDMRQYFEPTDYAHLYREKNSGIYYARMDSRQGGRKTIRRSLRTKELTEAIARMAAFLQEMGADTPAIGNISWYVAVDTYIAQQKMRPNLKPRALESVLLFAEHARKLVEQDMAVEAITANMCRLWWTQKAQSCSPRTANGALGAVRKIFAMLIDSRSVVSDPTYSGLRIEEARRLVWGDIGTDSIFVPAIKHAVKRRVLHINPALREVIERMRKTKISLAATSPVFVIENPRKALTNACIRLGLPHVRVHDLRHFFATTCIEQGVDIPTVAKWLGHQDGGALAMRVYGHLRDDHSREQASRLKF